MATPTFVQRAVVLVDVLVLLLAAPGRALAWGDPGHRIVAHLAARLLTESAGHQVSELLVENESLDTVAVWADTLRGSFNTPGIRPETPRWHFVDIPLQADYDAARDCPETPNGGCVVSAVAMFQGVLASKRPGYYANSRAEALKFLVHLVGDLHQPLHCVDDQDAGGNLKRVVWLGGEVSKLHAVWDDGILGESMRRAGLADALKYADRLFAELSAPQRQEASPPASTTPTVVDRATLETWARAAHAIARHAYADIGAKDANNRYHLGTAYYTAHKAEVDDQLKRAGIRLARILNENLR
jgi:nuclease S1